MMNFDSDIGIYFFGVKCCTSLFCLCIKSKKKPIRIIEYNIVRKSILNICYMYGKREINYTSFFYECISTRVTFPLAPEVLFSMPTWLPSGAASEKAIFPRQDLCTVSFPVDSLDLRSWKETNKNSPLTKTCVYVIRWWPVRFTCFFRSKLTK